MDTATDLVHILNDTTLVSSSHTTGDDPTEGISVGTILWASVNGVLFVCILCGNILTIIAVRTCRRLRSVISNLFILSLAISDFIVGLALPYHITFYLGSNLGKSHELCLSRFFLIIFACCVSVLTLIAIAVDRYIAIVYALHYRRYMTRRVALLIIAVNWIAGAAIALIPLFWNHWSTAAECEFNEILPPWYMAGFLTPGFVVIWIFMLLIYWRIMREASKHARQLRNSAASKESSRLISDWKSVQIVVFIMGCFSICWLPYFIVACAQIFDICKINPLLYKGAFSLAMTNSGLNPIIYSWKNSTFRQAFAQLLHCKSPNGMHHMDASQWSVRSHSIPRHNSMPIITSIPPPLPAAKHLSMPEQQVVGDCGGYPLFEAQDICSNIDTAIAIATNNDYYHCTTVPLHSSTNEDASSVSECDATNTSCVMCKKLLRKSIKIKHNIIQKVIDDEIAKYTVRNQEAILTSVDESSPDISSTSNIEVQS